MGKGVEIIETFTIYIQRVLSRKKQLAPFLGHLPSPGHCPAISDGENHARPRVFLYEESTGWIVKWVCFNGLQIYSALLAGHLMFSKKKKNQTRKLTYISNLLRYLHLKKKVVLKPFYSKHFIRNQRCEQSLNPPVGAGHWAPRRVGSEPQPQA